MSAGNDVRKWRPHKRGTEKIILREGEYGKKERCREQLKKIAEDKSG